MSDLTFWQWLTAGTPLLPLLLAPLALLPGAGRMALKASAFAALPAVVLAFTGLFNPAIEGAVFLQGAVLGAGFDLREGMATWLFFTSILWLSAGWYSIYYMDHDERAGLFSFFFLGAMAGNFGLVLAADPVMFFTCFAVMSFMSYGLVIHDRQPASMQAGRVYLGMAILGEVLQFIGLSLTLFPMIGKNIPLNFQSLELFASVTPLAAGLFMAGFGIKAGVLGLHVWLPMAHPVAPTPASAVLSGSMIKAGLLGWINLMLPGAMVMPGVADAMIVLGLCGAVGAALAGATQTHPKAVLAYSSVSQMGLMITAIGVALAAPDAAAVLVRVVALYAVHHAFAKCLLFLSVGIKTTRPLTGWERSLFWGGTLFAALALIGLPLTGGALAKAALKDAVYTSGLIRASQVIALLTVAAAGTTLLMIRFAITLNRLVYDEHHATARGIWLPWLLLLVGVLGGTLAMALHLFDHSLLGVWRPAKWWSGLWPLLLGVGLYGGAVVTWKRTGRAPLRIPAGDFVHGYAAVGAGTIAAVNAVIRVLPSSTTGFTSVVRNAADPFSRFIGRMENSFMSWSVGGLLASAMALLLFWLALM